MALGPASATSPKLLLFVVTDDWYFVSHRLSLARGAVHAGYRVVVATRVHAHGEAIRAVGCELVPLGWQRGTSRLGADGVALWALVRLYRRLQPELVHHIALKPIVLGSLAAAVNRVPAVVNSISGMGYLFTGRERRARILRPLMRLGLRVALGRRRTAGPRACDAPGGR